MIGNMSIDAELGCYDNAEKLLSIPNSLVTALGTVMLPRVSNSIAKGELKSVNEMIQKSMLFVVFATSALVFGICAVAKEFVPLFFGTDNQRFFYQLDGEGIRYEIVAFAKSVEVKKPMNYVEKGVSKSIAKIIESFNDRTDMIVI